MEVGVVRFNRQILRVIVPLVLAGASGVAAARPLSEIEASHTFTVCLQQDNAPFSMNVSDPRGLLVDLSRAVAHQLGVRLAIDWLSPRDSVEKSDCDALPAARVTAGNPHSEGLWTTDPYFVVRPVVVTNGQWASPHSFDDLKKGTVAVPVNSMARYFLSQENVELRVAYFNAEQVLTAVADGSVNAGIVVAPSFEWYKKSHPHSALQGQLVENINPTLAHELAYKVGFGLRRSDDAAVSRINTILHSLVEKQVVSQVFKKYGIEYYSPR